jgi:DNA-binding SARP family transcriptional activator/Tfp pilus assembly protein PilF
VAGGVEWRVLGPVEVLADATPLPLGRPQQRGVLAYLLLNANLVVPIDRLIEAIWGGNPPATARAQMHTYTSRLRQVLQRAVSAPVLVSQPAGYRLVIAGTDLDLTGFLDRIAEARAAATAGRAAEAAELYRAGLAHWRGAALSGATGAFVAPAALRLHEQRLAAHEELNDLELSLGRHTVLLEQLRNLIETNPLRQRLVGQLMLALHRDGRQAEALQVFADFRRRLAAEHGLDPGADLVELHRAIARADPALRLPAGTPAAPAPVVPRQLPSAVAGFVGRAEQLAALSAELAGRSRTVVISAIGGTAGVGKTALAVHWARQIADRFPDGQLYVNLRGFDPGGSALDPAEAVRGFIEALQESPQRMPTSPDAQVGRYRSLLADRRVLLLLDNARDAEQVRPLLPGAPGCLVLVTSRNRLAGLVATEGAHPFALDLLSTGEARELLIHRLGAARVAAEPEAVDEIIRSCARLPLALTIVAARAAMSEGLTALADELRARPGDLDAFDLGEDATANARAVFSWSYDALERPAARLFRLLGLHPGAEVTAASAASLAGLPAPVAETLLSELSRAHLVTATAVGRYAVHDLLRAYAAERAGTDDTEAERRSALVRVLDHYLHTAVAADRLLHPNRRPIETTAAAPGVTPEELGDHERAMAWFIAEHQVLVAAIDRAAAAGLGTHAWQLAWALVDFFHRRGHWHEWVATQRTALEVTRRVGDRLGQAQAHRLLGLACLRLGDLDVARDHLLDALSLFTALGDSAGQASSHRGLGRVAARHGRYDEALRHAEQTLELFRATDDRAGEANVLNAIGWYHTRSGNHAQALAYCRRALELHVTLGDRFGQANTWDSLGLAHHRLDQYAEAVSCYRRSLDLSRELTDRYGEADTLTRLGDTHQATGDPGAAVAAWRTALTILEDLRHVDTAQVRRRLQEMATSAR